MVRKSRVRGLGSRVSLYCSLELGTRDSRLFLCSALQLGRELGLGIPQMRFQPGAHPLCVVGVRLLFSVIALKKKNRRLRRGCQGQIFKVRSAKCEVRSAKCEVRSARCGVRSAECEVRSAECGVYVAIGVEIDLRIVLI